MKVGVASLSVVEHAFLVHTDGLGGPGTSGWQWLLMSCGMRWFLLGSRSIISFAAAPCC
jgi:hypothetical protein